MMAPFYYHHIARYPNTLLCHLLGHHRVRHSAWFFFSSFLVYFLLVLIPCHRGVNTGFVVLENAFTPHLAVSQQFDLKGSTVDREVLVFECRFFFFFVNKSFQVGEEKMAGGEFSWKRSRFSSAPKKVKSWSKNESIFNGTAGSRYTVFVLI